MKLLIVLIILIIITVLIIIAIFYDRGDSELTDKDTEEILRYREIQQYAIDNTSIKDIKTLSFNKAIVYFYVELLKKNKELERRISDLENKNVL